MADRRSDHDGGGPDEGPDTVVVRRSRWRRIAKLAGLAVVLLLLVVLAVVWIARRPIASNLLEREFERRGVQATYSLDRVGLRTQVVSNLVIGDPRRPDLIARYAQIQVRPQWDGSIEVYRIVARGVRLRGRVIDGKVSWGQIDRLLPPPSDKPFQLPDFVLDVADSSISLGTPFGPLGIAVQGSGRLSGGFKGRLALASPQLNPGRCRATDLNALVRVQVVARRPHVIGPVSAESFACPVSRFQIAEPRFEIDSRFNESFTRYDGRGRMAIRSLIAGENGLANFVGELTFNGEPAATYGSLRLAAQRSRLATIFAERTRLDGRYRLGITSGSLVMVGDYAAEGATLNESEVAVITGPLEATRGTPLGPVATAIGAAISRTVRQFDASGEIRMVNFAGGGAARIETAEVRGPNGARVSISGGDGVTYYWPSGRVRVDGLIETAGGGLPAGRIVIRQPRNGAPMSGVAEFRPYTANGSRLALTPIRFAAARDGSTAVSTVATLDGPFPEGRVRGLRLPISARLGRTGSIAIGQGCVTASFAFFQMRALQLGPTRLPICPEGPAILTQNPGGPMRVAARINRPVLAGRLGDSPLRLEAATARIVDKQFSFADLSARLGQADSPIRLDADRLQGTFQGSGINGTFAGAEAIIGNVPILLSDASGDWRVYQGDVLVDADATVADRAPEPRFYPLRTNDLAFKLDDDGSITAAGSLVHPGSGALVTNVSIDHDLDTGAGNAVLDVPGLTFGPGLQPEEITRLTEGVIALVSGTIRGQGRINWSAAGEVTSTGDFSTDGMDLAAPFGPVTGMRGTIHFNDLLGLTTPPGQVMNVATINPGILVENGVITYQLLPDQLVKIERGEWPFMGGRLILRETVLNFGRPSAKRLTFEVVGFDAKMFVDNLGFEGIEITGTFDGVLPMIFDESGGRIVGGRLDSRLPGGRFRYTGTKPDAGLVAGAAFDLLSDINYQNMVIRLEGDLAGEFATRFTIQDISLGKDGGLVSNIIRSAFSKVPLIVNLNIKGPFRALIEMAKGFKDPTAVIEPVLPFPLDAPGIVTETRTIRKEEDQDRTTPLNEVDVSTEAPQPPQPSE